MDYIGGATTFTNKGVGEFIPLRKTNDNIMESSIGHDTTKFSD
jgi:hypothetical protein